MTPNLFECQLKCFGVCICGISHAHIPIHYCLWLSSTVTAYKHTHTHRNCRNNNYRNHNVDTKRVQGQFGICVYSTLLVQLVKTHDFGKNIIIKHNL